MQMKGKVNYLSLVPIYFIFYIFILYFLSFSFFLITQHKIQISFLYILVLLPLLVIMLFLSYKKEFSIPIKFFWILFFFICYVFYNMITYLCIATLYSTDTLVGTLTNIFSMGFNQLSIIAVSIYTYSQLAHKDCKLNRLLNIFNKIFKITILFTFFILIQENILFYFFNKNLFELIRQG